MFCRWPVKSRWKFDSTARRLVGRLFEITVKILCDKPMPTFDRVKPVQPAYIIEPAFANGHVPNFISDDDFQRRGVI